MGLRIVWLLLSVLACLATTYAAPSFASCVDDPYPYSGNNILRPGDVMTAGGAQRSSARAALRFTSDGVLELLRLADKAVLWRTPTAGQGGKLFSMSASGMAITTSSGAIIWVQNFTASLDAVAVIEDNCNFRVFYTPPLTRVLWAALAHGMCYEVHLVPHSHDDVGWLLTPERYYDGCRNPGGGVRGILTSVVQCLHDNPNRTFNEVEIYFFERWWAEQNATVRATVTDLVRKGQLSFINAGWSMHDEACVHQEGAINNMAKGAQFLRQTFGDLLKLNIGWHIDPFGHASTTPRIMAQMGFDAFFFWRPGDVQQHTYKLATKEFETVWDPSPSLGDKTLMFTSILYNSYCFGCADHACVSEFCCFDCEEQGDRGGDVFGQWRYMESEAKRRGITDLNHMRKLFGIRGGKDTATSVESIAAQYGATILEYGDGFRTPHVMMPWGCDFAHDFAQADYALMDKIIDLINANASLGMHIFYSTPDKYVRAVQEMNYAWPRNGFDYFVYADYDHAYWSGYYSSRAEWKGYERLLMNERSTAEILLSSADPATWSNATMQLERQSMMQQVMGITQHHDAITGTEREHVRNRYQLLMTAAWQDVIAAESDVANLTSACMLANISRCAATEPLAEQHTVTVALVNPLSRMRVEMVSIPVPVVTQVMDDAGNVVPSQCDEVWKMTTSWDPTSPTPEAPLPFTLTFEARVGPLATRQYQLSPMPPGAAGGRSHIVSADALRALGDQFNFSNAFYQISVDSQSGEVVGVLNMMTGIASPLAGTVRRYSPRTYREGGQQGGAYIFRTAHSHSKLEDINRTAETMSFSLVQGDLCTELRQELSVAQAVQQSWRLCQSEAFDYVEVGVGAGPVNAGDWGIEVIQVLRTDVASNGTWWTDSEGLEQQKRWRDSRPNYPYEVTEPIASNFFPANIFAVMRDDSTGKNLAVVSDRTRGCGSIFDGEFQFLVLRRLLFDDNRGVSQALDERIRLLSVNRVYINDAHVNESLRFGSLKMAHPLVMRFVADGASLPQWVTSPSFVKQKHSSPLSTSSSSSAGSILPAQVHLHTRSLLNESAMLIRLQHLFSVNESSNYSTAVLVDLRTVLPQWLLGRLSHVRIVETDLNGITRLSDISRLPFAMCRSSAWESEQAKERKTASHDEEEKSKVPQISVVPSQMYATLQADGWRAVLRPMDIATFIVHF